MTRLFPLMRTKSLTVPVVDIVSFGKGAGTCEPGQRADLTGCTPKFGCLMAVLDEDLRKRLTDWTTEHVPDFHLGPGGREFKQHVTIKYPPVNRVGPPRLNSRGNGLKDLSSL